MTTETHPTVAPERQRVFGSYVSGVLGRAGFTRQVSEPTSVRGHRRETSGYRVLGENRSWESGYLTERHSRQVTVHHEPWNDFDVDRRSIERGPAITEALNAYASALEDVGLDVEVIDRGPGARFLVVSGRLVETPERTS